MALVDAKKVAAALGVSAKKVKQLARDGMLPGSKVGRVWRFDLGDVERAVKALRPAAK